MADVKLLGLNKHFGTIQALKDVSFNILNQEFVTLLGPTGAGKTTTLRCLVGLETPDKGEVFVDDMNYTLLPPGQRNMAFVSQHYALYPHMTVYKNMQFPLNKTNLTSAEKKARIAKIADLLHIEPLLNRYPSKLSGGEMQRVVIGRAMVRDPSVFLMDEPLSNLDAKLREELRFELKRMQKEAGATTLYVTHDQIEAMSMSDRVVVLNKGEIQQIGTPSEIYTYPANILVASIVGSPSMNLIPVAVENGKFRVLSNGHSSIVPEVYDGILSSGKYKLGIRPEDISIVPDDTPNSLPADAYLIEAFGYEKLVEINMGNMRLRARVSPRVQVKTGDKISILFNENKIRFYKEDGELIRSVVL
jgi:multiple sugar transport system ATP-binding protein